MIGRYNQPSRNSRRSFIFVPDLPAIHILGLAQGGGDSRLAPVDGRKWENRLNRCDLSAKGRLPDVYLLKKIPLIYYLFCNNQPTTKPTNELYYFGFL
jgi:hypothetical protein